MQTIEKHTVMIMNNLVYHVSSEHYIPEYDQNQDTNVPVKVINVSMVSPLSHLHLKRQCLNWMLHLTVYFWHLKPLTDCLNVQDYQTWCR